jgi:hypothetical protein
MNNKETVIYQGDSKWSRNAYIKFVGDKIVFDCSDGEYGPIEFDIQSFYDAELKHAQDIDNDWDVTLMDGLENEPYVSDDFQIGPDGAYEDVEYSTSIIDEAYENYTQTKVIKTENGETHISPPGHYNGITQEEFINKCKTDPEFSEKWGLKIEERELSLEERLLLADKINKEIRQDLYTYAFNNPIYTGGIDQRPDDVERHHLLSDLNIPTKLITITYNNKTIESYE